MVLVEDGDAYTFGNNTHGQLGNGGISSRDFPLRVHFHQNPRDPLAAVNPDPQGAASVSDSRKVCITQITAGKSFSAFLDSTGQVFVCGLPKVILRYF